MPQYIYVCENYENAKMFFGHDCVTNRPNLFQVPYRPKCFSNGGRGTTSYVWFICQKCTFWPFYLPQCRLQPSPGVFLVSQAINVGLKKLQTLGPATRWWKRMMLCVFVFTWQRLVTDRRTDGQRHLYISWKLSETTAWLSIAGQSVSGRAGPRQLASLAVVVGGPCWASRRPDWSQRQRMTWEERETTLESCTRPAAGREQRRLGQLSSCQPSHTDTCL